jgi:hypothetical protein
MLIDRVFGTYAREEAPVRYGLTVPVKTWNPLWANMHCFVELSRSSMQTRRWRDRIKLWFAHPGWLPSELRSDEPKADTATESHYQKFETRISATLWRYCLLQYGLAGAAILPVMAFAAQLDALQIALLLAFATWSGINVGGLQQASAWAAPSETYKWLLTTAAGFAYAFNPAFTLIAAASIGLIGATSLVWLYAIRRHIRLLPSNA